MAFCLSFLKTYETNDESYRHKDRIHECDLVFLNESKKLRLCRLRAIIMFGNIQSKTPFIYSLSQNFRMLSFQILSEIVISRAPWCLLNEDTSSRAPDLKDFV